MLSILIHYNAAESQEEMNEWISVFESAKLKATQDPNASPSPLTMAPSRLPIDECSEAEGSEGEDLAETKSEWKSGNDLKSPTIDPYV
jgi:hypothetical protein